MKHKQLTHTIIGCAMKVHSTLGSGFQEVIYQRALAIEMTKQNLAFEREMEMEIFYEDHLVGIRRVNFFVEDKMIVELKAVSQLDDIHLAQAMNYSQSATNIAGEAEVGYILGGSYSKSFTANTIEWMPGFKYPQMNRS